MSRNSLILKRAVSENTSQSPSPVELKAVPRASEYSGLVRSLFPNQKVVALIDAGSGTRAPEACRGIAAELAASGNRVVIVQVNALLRMSQIPDLTACAPGQAPNVFRWPCTVSAPVEFFPSTASRPLTKDWTTDWLGSLRRDSDAVLLECPSLATAADAATIAAMAEAAVLVVDAGRTTKQQIQLDQQSLKLRGVKLSGCILMKRR